MADEKTKRLMPLLDQEFLRKSLAPVDIEERRRFEELLIRYDILSREDIEAMIAAAMSSHIAEYHSETIIEDDDDDFTGACYWIREGSDLVYYAGNVGVGVHPYEAKFEVRGDILAEGVGSAPCVEIRNWSDTAGDPLLKWSLGSLATTKFVFGVDDSDSDKLKIANMSALGTLAESQGAYGERLVFFHEYDDNICYVDLDDFTTDGILYNGTAGSADGQFSNPRSITYDGTYLYVADNTNNRIQKFDAATGTWIASHAVTRPWGICHWNGILYVSCTTSVSGKG
ncbi:MAG: hypothetical protein MZV49_24265 [Rhodopseudomonas palustris]|nr:hypothetical protein [Rhodopseudomonas palustris]